MSRLKRAVVSQFGKPRGFWGALAGWIMATRPSNRLRNSWAVDLLEIRATDRVLEIGYGPGFALEGACRRASAGKVVGLDHSPSMGAMAARRNRAAVASGRFQLEIGPIEALKEPSAPAFATPFDRIFAVNVVMFWNDPVAAIGILESRLAARGRIALTFQPRIGERTDAAALAAAETMACQMRDAGLAEVRIETLDRVSPMAVCVMGTKTGIGK